jgi:hypothetical protein
MHLSGKIVFYPLMQDCINMSIFCYGTLDYTNNRVDDQTRIQKTPNKHGNTLDVENM